MFVSPVCAPAVSTLFHMQPLSALLDSATRAHGCGAIYVVFESLLNAHAVHIEVAPHGCFIKAHYRKSSTSRSLSPASTSASPTTVSFSPALCRNDLGKRELLRVRQAMLAPQPPGISCSHNEMHQYLFDMATDDVDTEDGVCCCSLHTGGLELSQYDISVTNTFVAMGSPPPPCDSISSTSALAVMEAHPATRYAVAVLSRAALRNQTCFRTRRAMIATHT